MQHTQQEVQYYYDQAKKAEGKSLCTSSICKPEEGSEAVTFYEDKYFYSYERTNGGEWKNIQPV